jgi:hypothetical protein
MEAENRFYQEFNKLRLPDKSSRTGYESDRAMGKRLGIHNKTITLYKRGSMPHPETITMIVKAGGYNTETFYRLLGAAARSDKVQPSSEKQIPVYKPEDIFLEGVDEDALPIIFVAAPMEMNVKISRRSLVGVKLDVDDNTCEPRIPRGAVVVYSSEPCDVPDDGTFYVFADGNGAKPSLVRVRGREIWRSGESLEDLVKITKDEFKKTALGKVVMAQLYMISGIVPD